MRVAIYDIHRFERAIFEKINHDFHYDLVFLETRLDKMTANLADECDVVCSFVNDHLDQETLSLLKKKGVSLVALRSAGFNHVDLKAAAQLELPIVRVPAYSPYAVAEHAVALLLTLNRKTHRAYQRVRELNFSLDGLVGFDLHGKVVGIVGTGRIGSVMAKIMAGFGCEVLAYDLLPNPQLQILDNVEYVTLEEIYRRSNIISLHVPLTDKTRHLIDKKALEQMRPGVFLINTSRGALIETTALIDSLKAGHIGAAGLDVYEEEENIFFQDLSGSVLQDDHLARLLTFPNVLITSHQGFLTEEAIHNIVETTFENINAFEKGQNLINRVGEK